jgi:hypothetical protein
MNPTEIAAPAAASMTPVSSPEFGSIKVEHDIPLPVHSVGRPRVKYPWSELKKKGDSFFVPTKDEYKNASAEFRRFKNQRRQANILAAFRAQVRKRSFKITTRTNPDGVRVWRTS